MRTRCAEYFRVNHKVDLQAEASGFQKRKRREAAAKEARRLELMRANEELVRRQRAIDDLAGKSGGSSRVEYDPFAEDERRPRAAVPTKSVAKVCFSVLWRILSDHSLRRQAKAQI